MHTILLWFYSTRALTKLYLQLFSNIIEYDRGDSFPLGFESNGISFDSENREELSLELPPQFGLRQYERRELFRTFHWLVEYFYQPMIDIPFRVDLRSGRDLDKKCLVTDRDVT